MREAGTADAFLVVDDGSTDRTAEAAREEGAEVISLGRLFGVGSAIRRGYQEALSRGADVAVVLAGNDKDDPNEIPRLIEPILTDRADLVQGSRWLAGGRAGNTPLYRRFATRLHPFLFSLAAGRRMTDTTNGFRAIRRETLEALLPALADPRLDGYELEPFLLFAAIARGYRVVEVPVTKVYPPKEEGRTKMRPFVDWTNILKPIAWAYGRKLGLPFGPKP